MVCLYDSQLFRESNIPKSDFTKLFSRLPELRLRDIDSLESFLTVCDFFMIDNLPFEDVEPFQYLFTSLDPTTIPAALKEWYSCLFLAFYGECNCILQDDSVYITQVMRWVHRHRIKWKSYSYVTVIYHNVAHTIPKLDTLFHLGVSPPSYALEIALERKNMVVIEWLLHHHVPLISYHLSVAMKHDFSIEFLEKLIQKYHCPLHSHTIASACSDGKLHYVKWWHENNFPFCTSAAAWAALWGHTNILRFLIQHKKPINRKWTIQNAYRSKNTMDILHLFQ